MEHSWKRGLQGLFPLDLSPKKLPEIHHQPYHITVSFSL